MRSRAAALIVRARAGTKVASDVAAGAMASTVVDGGPGAGTVVGLGTGAGATSIGPGAGVGDGAGAGVGAGVGAHRWYDQFDLITHTRQQQQDTDI